MFFLQDPGQERVINLSPRHAGAVVPVGPIADEVAESDILPKVIQAQLWAWRMVEQMKSSGCTGMVYVKSMYVQETASHQESCENWTP